MKALYEALALPEKEPFLVREFDQSAFEAPFHFHPEIELTLITSGQGERYVGSHMARFEKGDLILIGGHTPHCWKLNTNVKSASCLVIQFTPEFLGDQFFNHPEMFPISQLLDKSQNGIQLFGNLKNDVSARMKDLMRSGQSLQRCLLLLQLLNSISTSREWNLLTTSQRMNLQGDNERMVRTMNYIQQHFRDSFTLTEIASVANMTPQAFCKFFKRSTRMTLTEVVNGYRLDYAIFLLTSTEENIAEIAYQSGFGDVSYFYKLFNSHKGLTPAVYRKKYRM